MEEIEKFCENAGENIWLSKLKEHILRKKTPNEPMSCLVFVRTREVCAALAEWAKSTDELKDLNPDYITGTAGIQLLLYSCYQVPLLFML